MSARARRATRKVDYSKVQDFSDEDLFEDSGNDEPAPRAYRKRASTSTGRKPRQSRDMMMQVDLDIEEGFFATRPVFTEKGYDPSLPPIRERFPFLPEYEEDGSPKIDLIVGRRLVDEKDEVAEYNDKEKESDNESEEDSDTKDDEGVRRTRQRRGEIESKNYEKKSDSPVKKDKKEGDSANVLEYEYLVKYKGRSYLHLEWKTGADLESMNKSAKGIYRRFVKKVALGLDEELEKNPEFDPSYVVPEKILDEAEQEITVELTDKELLRWEKQREKELAAENDGSSVDDDTKTKSDDNTDIVKIEDAVKKGGSFFELGVTCFRFLQ
jgi:hypothetical protein